jgi:hypothetical protein
MKKGQHSELISRLQGAVRRALHPLAMGFANWTCDENLHPAPADGVRLAGCVVCYFEKEGFKHFITVNSTLQGQADGMVRFPSFFGLISGRSASETMKSAVSVQLGEAFSKSLDAQQLATDQIAAAPTFRWKDSSLGTESPVQVLVWAVRITARQAQLIHPAEGLKAKTIPEFAMGGQRVSEAHKLVFQSVQRHVQGREAALLTTGELLDQLDEIFGEAPPRILH